MSDTYFNHVVHRGSYRDSPAIWVEAPASPFSIVSLWFRSGARFDPADLPGAAHLVEHVFFRANGLYASDVERLRANARRGFLANAVTNAETVRFFTVCPNESISEAAGELWQMLATAHLPVSSWQNELGAIAGEDGESRANPWNELYWTSMAALYGADADLAKRILGDVAALAKARPESMASFAKERFSPDKAMAVVISPQPPDGFEEGNSASLPRVVGTKPPAVSAAGGMTRCRFDCDRVHVALNYRSAPEGDPDQPTLDLLVHLLSNTWSSRLVGALRLENNMAYWVDGENIGFSDGGCARFTFSAAPAEAERAVALAKKEIAAVAEGATTDRQLADAKRAYRTYLLSRHLTQEEQLEWHGWQFALGVEPKTLAQHLKEAETVSLENLNRVAGRYLTPAPLVVELGPVDETS
jgi:predicted Zn-dependent peptidase